MGKLQKNITKTIKGLRHFPYKARLMRLLICLEKGNQRYDSDIKNYGLEKNITFPLSYSTRTRAQIPSGTSSS